MHLIFHFILFHLSSFNYVHLFSSIIIHFHPSSYVFAPFFNILIFLADFFLSIFIHFHFIKTRAVNNCTNLVENFDWSLMEKVQYETYDTNEVYDSMDVNPKEDEVMSEVAVIVWSYFICMKTVWDVLPAFYLIWGIQRHQGPFHRRWQTRRVAIERYSQIATAHCTVCMEYKSSRITLKLIKQMLGQVII